MTSLRKPRPNPVTCYDVAKRAGVSQSSVSRAFRPDGVVARATRARVMAAAAELGYHPNAFAQGLITGRSNLVAILLATITNLTYPEMLASLTDRLAKQGFRALLFTLDSNAVPMTVLDQVWRFRVDGAIAIAQLTPEQIKTFARHDVPLVLYNRVSNEPGVGSVCCDSIGGEQLLVDGLVAAGHRRIGIIAGLQDSHVGRERLASAVARLEAAGIAPAAIAHGRYDYESGAETCQALLNEAGELDAIICANDLMAIGAIDAARDRGLRVPKDISVVGFDGIGPGAWRGYRLTTVRQPVAHMVDATVSMLLDRVQNPDRPTEHRLFAGDLIRGTSARIVVGDHPVLD